MKQYLIPMLLVVAATAVQGQSAIPFVVASTGVFRATNGIQISWTIGEPITTTVSAQGIIVTQGFHQPESKIASGVEPQVGDGSTLVTLYPNPTNHLLFVTLPAAFTAETRITLSLLNGQEIQIYHTNGERQLQLNLASFASGAYLLRVVNQSNGASSSHIVLCQH